MKKPTNSAMSRRQVASASKLVFASVTLTVMLALATSIQQVQCSSYLDSYFMPTAKLALAKIQQSLSPVIGDQQQQQQATSTPSITIELVSGSPSGAGSELRATQPASGETADANGTLRPASSFEPATVSEPGKGEFVKLELAGANSPPLLPPAATDASVESSSASRTDEPALVISSTEMATETDPTLSAATATEDELAVASESSVASVDGASSAEEQPKQPVAELTETNNPVASTDSPSTSQSVDASQQSTAETGELEFSAGSGAILVTEDSASSTTTTPTTTAASKSAEESVRETEINAVAAVDASIGFGDLFPSMGDPCYDEYGNARFCEPDFENIAFERQVEVSSECGSPPSRFCTAYLNEGGDQRRNCHICDAHNPKKRHPASYLTDMNNSNDPTCWVSAPISAAQQSQSAANSNTTSNVNPTYEPSTKLDNVTLVLNLDKKFEIVYISMQFCSLRPDSLAIYKSSDFAKTWTPYQFYSSQCRRYYNKQASSKLQQLMPGETRPASNSAGVTDRPEAQCMNTTGQPVTGPSSGRLAFSPLEERAGRGSSLEKSSEWQEWITATNIKIVLDRHHQNWILSSLVHPHGHHHHHYSHSQTTPASRLPRSASSSNNGSAAVPSDNNGAPLPLDTSGAPAALATESPMATSGGESSTAVTATSQLTNPSDTFNYAMSDLTVGGRCKCNGHASRCILGKEGRLQCDCRHNTGGADCEKCAQFHYDRPWARASQLDANPCQPCNCNGHSRKCKFDAELYQLSGKRSGGVCLGCRDNTAGRYCHYCREGYTRDHTKAAHDKEVCKHCECHPIGSLGRVCNITTGQCPCKEGVTGLQCTRCAPGYQQSSSPTEPCIKLPENDINWQLATDDAGATSDQQPSAPAEPVAEAAEDTPPGGGPQPKKPQPPFVAEQEPGYSFASESADRNKERDRDEEEVDGGEQAVGAAEIMQPPLPPPRRKSQRPPSRGHWSSQPQSPTWAHHQPQRHNSHMQSYGGSPKYELMTSSARAKHQQFSDEHLMGYPQPLEPIELDEREMDSLYQGRNVYYQPRYYPTQKSKSSRFHASNEMAAAHGQQRRPMLAPGGNGGRYLPAVASLDETGGLADDLNSLDESPEAANYLQTSSVYTDENFNQIQAPRRPIQQQHQASKMRQQQMLHQMGGAGGRRLSAGHSSPASSYEPEVANNELSCGECQLTSRKLTMRQFCRLDFALKASIVNKQVAEDWTRFDVEIQDIFKSPGADSLLGLSHSRTPALSGPNYIDSLIQASGESVELAQGDERNRSRPLATGDMGGARGQVEPALQQQQPNASPVGHRIKVGSVQSIWVPTEDLACKCPRLKLKSTYLLMGSVDLKENSANTLQLDRHGVAVEWDSSQQRKLLRFQRRQSRGKCS